MIKEEDSSKNVTHEKTIPQSMGSAIADLPSLDAQTQKIIIKNKIRENIAPARYKCNANKNLPVVLLANIQSFGRNGRNDKRTEVELVLAQNNVDIAVFTETWLCETSSEDLPFSNFVKFHFIRKNTLRHSGGVSIFVNESLPATRLDVKIPSHLECLWVSIRPKWLPRAISNIIICGIYYPGSGSVYAPPQDDLISYLIESVQKFVYKYSNPLFLLMGDFNDLDVSEICETCHFQQVVKVPTRKDATIDLILTNLNNDYYDSPVSLPKIGDGDHYPVLHVPKVYIKPKIQKKKIEKRIFKRSAMLEFGFWLGNFDWSNLFAIEDVNEKITFCHSTIWEKINEYFPLKKIEISENDKEWITPEIKLLMKEKQKAHFENKCDLKDHLAKKLKHKIKEEKLNHNKAKADLFKKSNSKDWYRHINNLINNGEKKNINFMNIPELAYKPAKEKAVIVNNHFSKICNKYPAIDKNLFVPVEPNETCISTIDEFETYKLINKFAKKALFPGDFPKKIMKEFAVELAVPFCDITNCSLKTGVFPVYCKRAEITPIPKCTPLKALSDLRPISKTPILGKIIEKRILLELQKDIKGKLDNDQYGNEKGCSTTHYLIKVMDEAYRATDKDLDTTAITIDYAKAFY